MKRRPNKIVPATSDKLPMGQYLGPFVVCWDDGTTERFERDGAKCNACDEKATKIHLIFATKHAVWWCDECLPKRKK